MSLMNEIRSALFVGQVFDSNVSVVTPANPQLVPGIWTYCSSEELHRAVKEIEPGVKANNGALLKLGFDQEYWSDRASRLYPTDLPRPYSTDPTQWIFHGHPSGSVIWDEESKRTAQGPLLTDSQVLQVAVACLLGYYWPANRRPSMELAKEQLAWVENAKALSPFRDKDGIVCVSSRGASGRRRSGCWNSCMPSMEMTGMMAHCLSYSPDPAATPWTTGCAISSSKNTAGCSNTVLSSGTSGTAASETAFMP